MGTKDIEQEEPDDTEGTEVHMMGLETSFIVDGIGTDLNKVLDTRAAQRWNQKQARATALRTPTGFRAPRRSFAVDLLGSIARAGRPVQQPTKGRLT